MATYFSDTFESYAAGNLVGQGPWTEYYAGSTTPRIYVVSGGLIDGNNAIRLYDAGGTPDLVLDEAIFGAALSGTKETYIHIRMLVPTNAGSHSQLQIQFIDGGAPGAQLKGYDNGSGKVVVWMVASDTVYTYTTNIDTGTKITLEIYVHGKATVADATFDLYANGTLLDSGKKFFGQSAGQIDRLWITNYVADAFQIPAAFTVYDGIMLQDFVPHPFPSFYTPV